MKDCSFIKPTRTNYLTRHVSMSIHLTHHGTITIHLIGHISVTTYSIRHVSITITLNTKMIVYEMSQGCHAFLGSRSVEIVFTSMGTPKRRHCFSFCRQGEASC